MIVENDAPYINLSAESPDLNKIAADRAKQEEALNIKKPSFLATMGAAQLSYNWLSRLATGHYQKTDPYSAVTSYDPIKKAYTAGITDERYLKNFELVDTDKEFQDTLEYVHNQQKYDRILSESSLGSNVAASLFAGASDPLVYAIPIGSIATSGKIATSLAGRIGTNALNFAPSVAASEAALTMTKPETTPTEAALAVTAGSVLGAAMGEAGLGLTKAARSEHIAKMVDLLKKNPEPEKHPYLYGSKLRGYGELSAGAAETPTPGNSLNNQKLSNALGASVFNPKDRLASSSNRVLRDINERVSPVGSTTLNSKEGIAAPSNAWAETQLYQAKHAKFVEEFQDSYKSYRTRVRNEGEIPISRNDFSIEVTKATHRFDEPGYSHPIPEVNKVAHDFQENHVKPLNRDAIQAGALDESFAKAVEEDPGHLHRMYNREKIITDQEGWNAKLNTILDENRGPAIQSKLSQVKSLEDKLVGASEEKVVSLNKKLSDVKRELLDLQDEGRYKVGRDKAARDITNNILGRKSDATFKIEPTAKGIFKNRTLNVKDSFIEDYLHNNILDISENMYRQSGADIGLYKSFGTNKFSDVYKLALKEHERLITAETNPKKILKLEKRFKAETSDLQFMWDMITGNKQRDNATGALNNTASALKRWQYLVKMGFFTITNISDAATSIFRHGTIRLVKQAAKDLPMAGISKELKKMRVDELKKGALCINRINHAYTTNMAGLDDAFSKGNMLQRFGKANTNAFTKYSLMSHFVDVEQYINGSVAFDRIADVALGKTKWAKEKEWLARLGLSETDTKTIGEQLLKHGIDEDGVWAARTSLWDPEAKDLVDKMHMAMRTDTALNFTESYPGSSPLILENPWWGVFSQLAKFMISMHKLTTVGIVNSRDRHFVQFLIASSVLGGLAQSAADVLKGKEIETDPVRWFYLGAKRSNAFTLFQLVDDKILTPFGVGSAAALGIEPDYMPRGGGEKVANLLGPSIGALGKLYDIGSAITSGKVTGGTVHSIRSLFPWQNHFALAEILNQAEDQLNDQMGIKRRKGR